MANKSEAVNKPVETPNTPGKKRGKKLELRAPFIKYEIGQEISGTIVMFTRQQNNKFGDRDVAQIQLDAPLSWPPSSKAKSKERLSAKEGDTVSCEIKAGLAGLKGLPEGTEVTIRVVDQIDTGKGNPAWSFEVEYD